MKEEEEEEEEATSKPTMRLVKKTYLKSGLYSTDLKVDTPPPASNSRSTAKQISKASNAVVRSRAGSRAPDRVNATFPLPINYGTTLIEKQRDFVMPYDIMHAWKHGLLRLTKQPEPFTKIRSSKYQARPYLLHQLEE